MGLFATMGTVAGYLAKARVRGFESEQARQAECIKHIENSQTADAQNLEDWKLKYVESNASITAQVTSLQETLKSTLSELRLDVRVLLTKMPELTARLDALERAVRDMRPQ